MADVRALLKAKRQEVRIRHPLAAYTASGQLQCVACGTTLKQGSSWDGHIGSKAHRTNATRLREREREQARLQEQERAQAQARKRKASEEDEDEDDEEGDDDDDDDPDPDAQKTKRRRRGSEPPPSPSPSPAPGARGTAFPADFFSDPARAPPPAPASDDSDDEAAAPAPAHAASSAVDLEWEAFQRTVVNAPDAAEAYERATLVAKPVLAAETPEGFPVQAEVGGGGAGVEQQTQGQSEAAGRRRREQEDRELIMDRLLDEERAQEEADQKVSVLKSKLDALKRRREVARALKGQK